MTPPAASCPYCKGTFYYQRERSGLVAMCPLCNEPVTLPKSGTKLADKIIWAVLLIIVACLIFAALHFGGDPGFAGLSAMALILGVAFLYFLPWFLASRRDHPNLAGIAVINLLLGWTLLGWVVALVWAIYRRPEETAKIPIAR